MEQFSLPWPSISTLFSEKNGLFKIVVKVIQLKWYGFRSTEAFNCYATSAFVLRSYFKIERHQVKNAFTLHLLEAEIQLFTLPHPNTRTISVAFRMRCKCSGCGRKRRLVCCSVEFRQVYSAVTSSPDAGSTAVLIVRVQNSFICMRVWAKFSRVDRSIDSKTIQPKLPTF